jgi:D-beta-D-heptose 7-phosphate kinase/D-beta-D-heptose 1-phosphate adenosyltransferase
MKAHRGGFGPNPTEKILQALDSLPSKRVTVIGDVMLDLFQFCRTEQSKPIDSEKPGKRAYRLTDKVMTLGGAGNVAVNLAALDVSTTILGVAGNDGNYVTLKRLAERRGIRHSFLRDDARPTTVKTRLYLDDGYVVRVDEESTERISAGLAEELLERARGEIGGSDVVILSDYDKGLFRSGVSEEIVSLCRASGVPVVVDAKPANVRMFAGADIIAPNAQEAAALVGTFHAPGGREQGVRRLFELVGAKNVVVTLGGEGVCGFDGNRYFHVPGHPVREVDAVGCGDTVRAVMAVGYASGLDIESAASVANDAAALIVQKPAVSSISRAELHDFVLRAGGEELAEPRGARGGP